MDWLKALLSALSALALSFLTVWEGIPETTRVYRLRKLKLLDEIIQFCDLDSDSYKKAKRLMDGEVVRLLSEVEAASNTEVVTELLRTGRFVPKELRLAEPYLKMVGEKVVIDVPISAYCFAALSGIGLLFPASLFIWGMFPLQTTSSLLSQVLALLSMFLFLAFLTLTVGRPILVLVAARRVKYKLAA